MKIESLVSIREMYPAIPVQGRQRKNYEFRANLGYK